MPRTKKKGDSLSADKRRYKISHQKKKDKESRSSAAQKRHDIGMRATGRKELASNYGKFPGETKKKKKTQKKK